MTSAIIKARALTRLYGRTRALDGLDVELGGNRVAALLGPNGAGKTTFLRLLSGLIWPTSGEVRVLREAPREFPSAVAARIVSAGEGIQPAGWATPRRLIALQEAASPGFDSDFAADLIRGRSIDFSKPYRAMSKGQKSWVVAAIALASPARLLLLDEPADGLDVEARRSLYKAIRQHVERHASLALVATHIIADIERVADDALFIDKGRLRLAGQLEDLREEVFEIETPAGEVPPKIENGEVLAQVRLSDVQLMWVQFADAEGALGDPALSHLSLRRVGLERLYLALCGSRDAFDAAETREVNQCA